MAPCAYVQPGGGSGDQVYKRRFACFQTRARSLLAYGTHLNMVIRRYRNQCLE